MSTNTRAHTVVACDLDTTLLVADWPMMCVSDLVGSTGGVVVPVLSQVSI